MRTFSRSVRAAKASISGVGVAAAPWTNTVMPLCTWATTSAGERATLLHVLPMQQPNQQGRNGYRKIVYTVAIV